MTRLGRILPVVGVALGTVLVAPVVGIATSRPATTDPGSSAPESSAPESSTPASTEPDATASRLRWLEATEQAAPETVAGGAELRDLVEGRRVLLIGDSIMAATSSRYGGEMCKELVPRGWEVEVDAESGRFVDFGDRVLDARLEDGWDVAVVMLGNNYGEDKTAFAQYLEEIVERVSPRPTVLLTVTEFRPDRVDVNDVIYDIAAANDNVRVVDWASETAADPALVAGDGLHLSNEGRVRYADMVGQALGRAPGFGEGDCLGSNFTDDSAVTIPTVEPVTTPPVNNSGGGGGGGGGDGGGGGGAGTSAPTTVPAPPPPPVETQPPAPPPPTQATSAPTIPTTTQATTPQPTTTAIPSG